MADKPNARKRQATVQIRVSDEVLRRLEAQANLYGVTRAQYATWLVAQGTLGTEKIMAAVAEGHEELWDLVGRAVPTEAPGGDDD